MTTRPVFGIDLGASSASVAYVDASGEVAFVPNAHGEISTPTALLFRGKDAFVIGQTARDARNDPQGRYVGDFKQALGKPNWQFEAFGKGYLAQELAALVLRNLAGDVLEATGIDMRDAVITCPASFGPNEIAATRQAGQLAGLNVLGTISDPVAAAYAFGFHQANDQVILVYDLGGGSFDLTLLQTSRREVNVLATVSRDDLGGDAWDAAIARYLASQFESQTGVAVPYEALLPTAGDAKLALTSLDAINVPLSHNGRQATVQLTRETFDDLTAPLLDETIAMTTEMFARARELEVDRVNELVVVGGGTYNQHVRARLTEAFQGEVTTYNPEHAVVEGAALYAYNQGLIQEYEAWFADRGISRAAASEEQRERAAEFVAAQTELAPEAIAALVETRVTGLATKSFGIRVIDAATGRLVVKNLIFKDTRLPASAEESFRTRDASQPGAELEVFQSESQLPQTPMEGLVAGSLPQSLGTAVLSFERPLPKGSPIKVSFLLTDDGTLQVTGEDLTTGAVVETGFKTEGVIDESELEGRRLALRARAYDDLTVQTANELELMARENQRNSPEVSSQLRQLRAAVTGDSQDAAWNASQPQTAFDIDLLTAHSNGTWRRFLMVTETLRNFLLFSPVMFTWYAIWKAMESYHDATNADPGLKSQPFLLLWQNGFFGHQSGPTLAEAAMTNTFLVAALIVLTLIVQFGGNIVERGMQEARGKAHATMLNASMALERRRQEAAARETRAGRRMTTGDAHVIRASEEALEEARLVLASEAAQARLLRGRAEPNVTVESNPIRDEEAAAEEQ